MDNIFSVKKAQTYKRLVLVYNPVSGKALFKRQLDKIIGRLQRRGFMVIPYRTSPENADLADFIRAARPDGILAAGGDGTVHEVVNLVMHEGFKVPVGIIGSGTSNDFATYLQLDTDKYFDRIAQGVTRCIDLGKIGDTYFINVASAGMATNIAHEVDRKLKNAIGKLAYYIHGIKTIPQFKSLDLHIKVDGREYDERGFLFLVVNSSTVASFKDVAVNAKIDDGKLDLLLVRHCNMPDLVTMATELFAGKAVVDQKNVLYLQGSRFEISCDTELESDIDGELGPKLPIIIDTIPNAIEIFC